MQCHLSTSLEKKPFENIMGKGEVAGYQQYLQYKSFEIIQECYSHNPGLYEQHKVQTNVWQFQFHSYNINTAVESTSFKISTLDLNLSPHPLHRNTV